MGTCTRWRRSGCARRPFATGVGHRPVSSSAIAGIERRLDKAGAVILSAERDDRTVGFVLVAPQRSVLEIFYLAVDPAMWGRGIATQLLRSVETHANTMKCATLQLWVIDGNDRAIGVYENAGWTRTDTTQVDVASGRVERRLVRMLDTVHNGTHHDELRSARQPT
ncbi:MAG: GNAT family N-acetyltransferase [Rhodococcus sp. (in: high G+C Gram-positive bacteria)]|uniref:GNAT family N-acetyltransferase n=1 Tax=Rhodococcus sp. TaxID=1831 RepID=UPI002AD6AF6C|nr:GNAT family N-acetyltransferase [Rhodococcus sp. (in: high G+C Gram-positive bacteria)]